MNNVTIEAFPEEIETTMQAAWWKPLAVKFGREVFAYIVTETAATGSDVGTHKVKVALRNADGSFSLGYCKLSDGTDAIYANDTGHNQPSVAVDGLGHIWVFTSMHIDMWRVFRSARPFDVGTMAQFNLLPDTTWGNSYPVLAQDNNGDVYAMVRDFPITNVTQSGQLYKFSLTERMWRRVAQLGYEYERTFYPDDLIATRDYVHILWEWGPLGAGTLRHLPSYARYDKQSGQLHSISGETLPMPQDTTAGFNFHIRELEPGEFFVENSDTANINITGGIQAAKLCMDGENFIGALYRHRAQGVDGGTFGGFNVVFSTFSDGQWQHETIVDIQQFTDIQTGAALSAAYTRGEARLFFSVEIGNNTADPYQNKAWPVMARNVNGQWKYSALTATSYRRLLRLRNEKINGGDLLIMTTPYTTPRTMYRLVVPENYTSDEEFATLSALISLLRTK
ncbi:TPA: BNR-4 repeat-containing protein [Klebsiella oxytoca]